MAGACGGTTNAKEATQETQDILDQTRSQIEEKLGSSVSTLEAKQFATQVVAGTNYFIKAHIGDNKYIHVRVFKGI